MEENRKTTAIKLRVGIAVIGVYLFVIALLLVYLFAAFWPVDLVGASSEPVAGGVHMSDSSALDSEESGVSVDSLRVSRDERALPESLLQTGTGKRQELWSEAVHVFGLSFHVSPEVRVIFLVIIAGALGSLVHVVTSFVDYVGNRSFVRSWTWWYFLRPISGSILALIFYLIVRGGLLSTAIEGTDLSRFAVTGLAGLVGLFSKQAIDKLGEIFDTVFLRKAKVDRQDMLKPLADQGSEEDDVAGKEGKEE